MYYFCILLVYLCTSFFISYFVIFIFSFDDEPQTLAETSVTRLKEFRPKMLFLILKTFKYNSFMKHVSILNMYLCMLIGWCEGDNLIPVRLVTILH